MLLNEILDTVLPLAVVVYAGHACKLRLPSLCPRFLDSAGARRRAVWKGLGASRLAEVLTTHQQALADINHIDAVFGDNRHGTHVKRSWNPNGNAPGDYSILFACPSSFADVGYGPEAASREPAGMPKEIEKNARGCTRSSAEKAGDGSEAACRLVHEADIAGRSG